MDKEQEIEVKEFLDKHRYNIELMSFIANLRNRVMMHSDRWSMVYDFLQEFDPEATGTIVTSLTYWIEQ